MQTNRFWKAVESTAQHIVENPRPYLANAALGAGLGGLTGGVIGMDAVPTLSSWFSHAWKGAALGAGFAAAGTALLVGVDDLLNNRGARPHAQPRNSRF